MQFDSKKEKTFLGFKNLFSYTNCCLIIGLKLLFISKLQASELEAVSAKYRGKLMTKYTQTEARWNFAEEILGIGQTQNKQEDSTLLSQEYGILL